MLCGNICNCSTHVRLCSFVLNEWINKKQSTVKNAKQINQSINPSGFLVQVDACANLISRTIKLKWTEGSIIRSGWAPDPVGSVEMAHMCWSATHTIYCLWLNDKQWDAPLLFQPQFIFRWSGPFHAHQGGITIVSLSKSFFFSYRQCILLVSQYTVANNLNSWANQSIYL